MDYKWSKRRSNSVSVVIREGFLEEEASIWHKQDLACGGCQKKNAAMNGALALEKQGLCIFPSCPIC